MARLKTKADAMNEINEAQFEAAQKKIENRKGIIKKHYEPKADFVKDYAKQVTKTVKKEKDGKPFIEKWGNDNYVHVMMVKHQLDPETEKPKFEPQIKLLNSQEWKEFLKAPMGWDVVKVLHLPKEATSVADYEKAQAEKRKNVTHYY